MEELENWIKSYFDWYKEGYDNFIEIAKKLKTYNVPDYEIQDILENSWAAVSNEYE